MSHIEKEKLIKADIASVENRIRHAFNQGYDLGFKDGKKRAKPLEQEPSGDNVVSRDVVKKQMIMYGFSAPDMTVTEFVEDLPPVNPKEATTKNDLGVDCISRQAVLDLINADWKYENLEIEINNLPSVTPQEPKTGHWNDIPKYTDIAWECSECGRFTTLKHNYCPMCGAKMVEPQESEEQE